VFIIFVLGVGVEGSIVNASRITDTDQLLFVVLLCRLTSGAFTIDSSRPTLRRNYLNTGYNEHYYSLHMEVVSDKDK
jgi:hypothetical protein